VADSRFVENNPEKIDRLVRAHIRATDFINNHPEESVVIGVRCTGLDERTVRIAIKNIKFDYIPAIEGEVEYVEFLNRLGYIKVDDVRSFTYSFINTTFIQ